MKKFLLAAGALAALSFGSVADAQMAPHRNGNHNSSARHSQKQRHWSYRQGQRLPKTYHSYTTYNGVPRQYRNRIPKAYRNGRYRYIYRDNAIYVVDPTTQLVRSIVDLLR
jgi:hypothetical protein